ncbi:hypothetical protein AAHC64_11845 [Klebsiella pneumoniae]|uniref:hypothetical protein n=1 Tax=Klebsiella pneumoniae TaxID=573 RepID=UPI0039670BD7
MDYFAVTLQSVTPCKYSMWTFIDTFVTRHITVECTLLALFSLAVRVFRQIPTAVAVATGPRAIK